MRKRSVSMRILWTDPKFREKMRAKLDARNKSALNTIALIDRLTGSEFCEELNCIAAFHGEELTPREKKMQELLGLIYRVAHSANTSNSCHSVHKDWRKEAETLCKKVPLS